MANLVPSGDQLRLLSSIELFVNLTTSLPSLFITYISGIDTLIVREREGDSLPIR